MAQQDVAELLPRVRRAVEGPVPLPPGAALTDDQLLAITADAIADVILFTSGRWAHSLVVTQRAPVTNVPTGWAVDPGLSSEEESMIAAQAALTYYFHIFKDQKISERIRNEGQEWEYTMSATLLRDQMAMLMAQRDMALEALNRDSPILARYASFLQVRDKVAAAHLEPWVAGGLGGGIELVP